MKPVEYLTDPEKWFLAEPAGPFWWWRETDQSWQIVTESGKVIVEGRTQQDCIQQLIERSEKVPSTAVRANPGDILWEPMPGKVVVRLLQEQEFSQHIVVPPQYQSVKILGQVIALGDDEAEGDDYPLKIGDTVAFGANSGIKLRIDRDEVLVLKTAEILTKVSWKVPNDQG